MSFTLIVPTILESSMTGFAGGIEKAHRGRLFRIEFMASGTVCKKDGALVAWEKLPSPIRKAAHEAADMINASRARAEAA